MSTNFTLSWSLNEFQVVNGLVYTGELMCTAARVILVLSLDSSGTAL